MHPRLFLADSKYLRFAGFFTFYFAQGVPIGLLTVALPAWLAAQGVDAAQIAAFVGITGIPWGVKLIAGPFMDRFSFPAMGRRRPWVMGAQAGLTLSMLAMTLVGDPVGQLWLVIGIGFLINACGALQDVAVDGMAIDVLPETERGRANAFMACGQVAGFSGFGALDGFLLVQFGLPVTALISAVTVGLVFLFITLTRERRGERILPWSEGEAAIREYEHETSFRIIFRDLFKVVVLPMSLIMLAVETSLRASAGVMVSILPVVAVQEFGFASDEWAYILGIIGGASAVVGIFVGPLIDRFGAKRFLVSGLFTQAVMATSIALLHDHWGNTTLMLSIVFVSELASALVFISMIAVFMNICWKKVAATQFAVYMSLSNLSRSIGAGLFALIAADIEPFQAFYIMSALYLLASAMGLLFDEASARQRIEQL